MPGAFVAFIGVFKNVAYSTAEIFRVVVIPLHIAQIEVSVTLILCFLLYVSCSQICARIYGQV